MDLKLNSIAWVGKNISQRFETMCQEMDYIVSQNTVKYVEDQMQTMGNSVKKFCSDVVQDILPPSADPVKHLAQDVVLKRNDAIGTYVNSVIGIEEADSIIKQSENEPNPVDPVKTQLSHTVTGPYQERELVSPSSADHVECKDSDLASGKVNYVLTYEISNVDVEENAIKEKSSTNAVLELISLGENGSIEASSICESNDCNKKNSTEFVAEISCATSVDYTHAVNTVCDNRDESISFSDASNAFAASEMASSVASCEEKVSETVLVSSCNSRLIESNSLHEDSPDNFPLKTVLYTDAVDGLGCVSDSCEAIPYLKASSIVSCKVKEAEVEHIDTGNVLLLESGVEDVAKTDYRMSPTEISRKTDAELYGSAQFEALATSSDNRPSHYHSDELDYYGMETIELRDNLMLEVEDSCVMVENCALFAVSYRNRKLRSFKQRIQDAFASKKRLAKEYEHLAIWFGDIHIEDKEDTLQSSSPSMTSATLDLGKSSKTHTCDSEWELL